MTASFDTGYEARFDFPLTVEQPRRIYMLATIPRTGSTYLSHLLWETGCLGAPLEYLNFEKGGHYGRAADNPELQTTLWKWALQARTSPNGVFGFKCFIMQLYELRDRNPELLSLIQPTHILYLTRNDRVAHAVSYARAHLSGVWCKEQANDLNDQIEYSQQALELAEQWVDTQTAAWDEMFSDLGVDPLRLCYEDVVADPAVAVQRVSNYLDVDIRASSNIIVPRIMKQSGRESEMWAARYAKSRSAM